MDHCSIVHEVFGIATPGPPRVTVVEADAGAGKTVLCQDVVARAEGWLTVSTRAFEEHADSPLAVLSEVLPILAGHVGRLQELLVRATIAEAIIGDSDVVAVATSLANMLRSASRERPVLLVIDDCQWCDAPSWRALLLALQRAGTTRVAVLLACRPGALGSLPTSFERRHLAPVDPTSPPPPGPAATTGPDEAVAITRQVLSARELDVCLAVAEGRTTRQAAAALFVSPKTIEFHLTHAYRKLGVANRVQLARLAVQGHLTSDRVGAAPDGFAAALAGR